jgi:hypothetical protein
MMPSKFLQYIFTVGGVLVILMLSACKATQNPEQMINQGKFSQATEWIQEELEENPNLTAEERLNLEFELARMARIRLDFQKCEADMLEYIHQYLPEVTAADLEPWEAELSLETMRIDGQKFYFNNAAPNLFRINPELKALKRQQDDARRQGEPPPAEFPLDQHISEVMERAQTTSNRFVKPVLFKIRQSVVVNADAVPESEILRCWIPFPREIEGRQLNIQLLQTEPSQYILADNQHLQRTIYFEKAAVKGQPTEFWVEYEYTSRGVYIPVDPARVRSVPESAELTEYLQEKPPHIVFSDELRKLSRKIVGNETNPYRIAQKLFEWVDVNIPWASAREYSTFYCIPEYVLKNRHGDCGMQALTFITLCRLNGIPARWQSGWEFQPPDDSMHDWGEIYFEPYGWVPMDVDYGLRDTIDEALKWFYLNGMDSYRLIFNDAISKPFYPAKMHFRSEPIDSQRGEVEWRGGNLYFNQWDWQLRWEVLAQ